ncbi:alpha/beta-hydrolase [Polyporus arcularius HHB13444]|uniref:Alpha/beta-hydrolase n=1 Tax=Polyporus arcularius HHB13444 TaxID=1314778 RepID=A0A5C3NR27_9APHY|nr:alpha/beta-hydrolase [Polyporus arcularius HHB13444]
MPPSSAFQWFLLVCPAVVILAYFFTVFPHSPDSLYIHPSLATLPKSAPSWSLYPDNYYPGGAYAKFPNGAVRYWLIGPEHGKRVVLIHGLSVPAIIWKDVAPQLAARGYRVLLYDLYGRGYSDAPHTTYDVNLYTTQLALLLQYVGWSKADIVGVSMGGGIAAAFVAQFPHLVTDKVVLIASAGLMESSDMSRTTKFLSSPLMQVVASSYPFRLYLQYLADQKASDDPISELVRIQSAYLPGYNAALASSIRDGPLRSLAPQFAALGRHSRKTGGKVLVIWGTADKVVPYRYASRVQTLIPHSELVTIDGGPHDITITHGDEVSRALLEFLGR